MPEKIKKIPLRKCVVTGNQLPKKDLLRVVRTPEGNIIVDDTSKANGRGVYLSKDKDVILQAKKKHLLDRHLEVHVDDSIYDELIKKVNNG